MNILNFFIDGFTVTVNENSTKKVICTIKLDNSDNISSIFFNLDNVELTFEELLSLQKTITVTIAEMLGMKESNLQVADCLYWQQLGFIF